MALGGAKSKDSRGEEERDLRAAGLRAKQRTATAFGAKEGRTRDAAAAAEAAEERVDMAVEDGARRDKVSS